MPVVHQVADQITVVGRLRSHAMADAGSLEENAIIAHVIDQADKAILTRTLRKSRDISHMDMSRCV